MKIIKFGGISLANGHGIEKCLKIIERKINIKEKFIVVVSARDKSTDRLENMLENARLGTDISREWDAFKSYQAEPLPAIDLSEEFLLLEKIFSSVKNLSDYTPKIKDLVLAQGELISAKLLSALLNQQGLKAQAVDGRDFLVTDSLFGNADVLPDQSMERTRRYFNSFPEDTLAIVTGFIAADGDNQTTTLGRNGSNYSASLLANYLHAEEVENYTKVDGIFTADPHIVQDAKIIKQLNYQDAAELSSFGASILHPKTIQPLQEKDIPLKILNSFEVQNEGTMVGNLHENNSIKAISIQNQVSLISIEGKGLLSKIGIDARIFSVLARKKVSIGLISQGTSERGVGFVVDKKDALISVDSLKTEFENERNRQEVSSIRHINDVSVITIIGQDLSNFSTSLAALNKNNIRPLLINNTINGTNIGMVLRSTDTIKAANIIHSQIFGVPKRINIAIFGKGNVGSALIEQILAAKESILARKNIDLNIFAITNSRQILFNHNGITVDWESEWKNTTNGDDIVEQVMAYASLHHLENLVAIDNTASSAFVQNYLTLIKNDFDLLSSNKIANTGSYGFYTELRENLKRYHKQYLYETNVGAGLPIIDTIRLLHESGENISRICGVFSGTLSYLFNMYSSTGTSFSELIRIATRSGYTEPDPRDDLNGKDVARKLLILARELDLKNELEEIEVFNLIPQKLQDLPLEEFWENLEEFDSLYGKIRQAQEPGHVLRYVCDLCGDLQQDKGILKVGLVSVANDSNLGHVRGSDSIFEIYTESYGEKPIIIQGAGAGGKVTARGVFGDLLRLAERK